MTSESGATIEPAGDCSHHHSLQFAQPGERVSPHRLWVVVADDFAPQEAGWPWGDPISLTRGTRLRYDQRDYDRSWSMQGWDRFCIIDGPDVGRCVFLMNPNCWGPIDDDEPRGMIAPLAP